MKKQAHSTGNFGGFMFMAAVVFGGLLAVVNPTSAQTWTPASVTGKVPNSVASLAEGTKFVAVANGSAIDADTANSSPVGSYSAVGDFSTNANPNGVWSYGWATNLGAPFMLLANPEIGTINFLTGQQATNQDAGWSNGLPPPDWCAVEKDFSTNSLQAGTVIWDADTLRMDPQSQAVIVRFTAPMTGSYEVTGLFRLQDTTTHAHFLSILLNGDQINFFVLTEGGQVGSEYPFNFPCSLAQGQTIDFAVSCYNGDWNNLSTGLDANVALIPQREVFNSGMSGINGNLPVAVGAPDPNFILVSAPPGGGTAAVVASVLASPFLANTASSQWISPDANPLASPAGTYQYQLQFYVCCANDTQLNGRMAAGGEAYLYLNGNVVGMLNSFTSWTPISLSSGFVQGSNVLDIYFNNVIPSFTGIRAELTNALMPQTVTVIANPANGGTVGGGGTFAVGSQVPISATPNTGWLFSGWDDGITNTPRMIDVSTTTVIYVANFETNAATITVIAAPLNGGTVSGGGALAIGSQVQISAAPNSGWRFTAWNDGDTNNPRSVIVPAGGAAYAATFQLEQATIVALANPFNGGTVQGGGTYNLGLQIEISANPDNGWTFTGWNDGSTQNPRTIAVPLGGAEFAAGFSFSGLNARFVGLFHDTNGVAPQSSGAFKATLTANGRFSATLAQGAKTYSFTGRFSPTGSASNTIVRSGESPLTLQLHLDSLGADVLNGEVTAGTWAAELVAERTTYSSTNHAQQAGKYTLAIPGGTNAALAPGGDGYGVVTVSTLGSITVGGALGDGTAFSQNATLTEEGNWPLYVSLYSGSGEIFGWLAFSNTPTSDVSGLLNWVKPPQAHGKFYPAGFSTNETQAIGSSYGFTNGHPILNFTKGGVLLTGGNLAEEITNSVAVTGSGKITGTNHLSLTVKTTSGTFSGSIVNPATKKTITLSGVVLEKQNIGAGYFLGTNESGELSLGPAP